MFNLFGKKSLVGIDIGTASIKLVELSKQDSHFKLETYGVAQITYQKKPTGGKGGHSPLSNTVSTLRELLKRARVKSNKIVTSLPTSTVFVTVVEIPHQTDPERQKTVIEGEASKVVPLPLDDVTVSWNILPGTGNGADSVLLTAVPNHVIANYVKVFEELKLAPQAIEVEVSALVRCLVGQDPGTVLILDIGSKSSTVSLIDKGFIYFSKHINVGGETIASAIAQTLNITLERAEQLKKSLGLFAISSEDKTVPRAIQPILRMIQVEIEQMLHLSQSRGRSVEKIITTGGGARLIGMDKYLSTFNIPVVIGNPWARVLVPENIKPMIQDLGPSMAVSIGLAMREAK